jgi:hypothetical protein
MDPEQQPQPREITIPINPQALLKWLSFVVLLMAVFFVGRFSAGGFTDAPTANVVAVEEVAEVVEEAPVVEEEPVVLEEPEVVVEEPEPEPEPEPEVVVEEPVVTQYSSKVTLGVEDLDVEWFGTWGKIKGFTLAIKNEEPGTIKPASAVMLLEGYNDLEKDIVIPADLFTIKSTETKLAAVTVTGGFSYHPKTVGNMDSVKVQIILKDATGTVIRGFAENMILPGE